MKFRAFLTACLFGLTIKAQVVNTGFVDTSGGEHLGKITVGGFVDVYANSSGAGKALPSMVSSANNNTFALNLAMLDVRYPTAGVRARLAAWCGEEWSGVVTHGLPRRGVAPVDLVMAIRVRGE